MMQDSGRARGRRQRAAQRAIPPLDIDGLIDDRTVSVVVCCGSGGVGKTTTAAALALRAAERGRVVAVMTIDPARRLAQALGLTALDNTPRLVEGIDTGANGSLEAMMLDMKRTFDEVVEAHTTPEKAQQILENPFYQALSSSFAGTQEYMAMEKLGQLHAQRRSDGSPRWDLIVVDTPPSRSALDFLDAPARLGSFLDGRFIRLLLAPAKAGGRAYLKIIETATSIASAALSKVLGSQLLHDVHTLVAALDTMFGGFRARADQTYALLQQQGTAFVVVASPERDTLREAGYFLDRLRADDMPLAGVVVNRMATLDAPAISGAAATDCLHHIDIERAATAAELLALHASLAGVRARHEAATERFADRQPDVPMVHVAAAARDIHDLRGLRQIGLALAGAVSPTAAGGETSESETREAPAAVQAERS